MPPPAKSPENAADVVVLDGLTLVRNGSALVADDGSERRGAGRGITVLRVPPGARRVNSEPATNSAR